MPRTTLVRNGIFDLSPLLPSFSDAPKSLTCLAHIAGYGSILLGYLAETVPSEEGWLAQSGDLYGEQGFGVVL